MTVAPALEGSQLIEERLADPAVARALVTLLDHADLLAVLVEGLDQLIARGEVIGDSLLSALSELREVADDSGTLADLRADAPRIVGTASKLVQSDLLDPAAVDTISLLARGLVRGDREFGSQPVPVTGVLSLRKVLRDPDVRRSLSYFATIAKAIGRELEAR